MRTARIAATRAEAESNDSRNPTRTRASGPGPIRRRLARRLFAWELCTDWDTFYGAAATYVNVLDEKGLAVYRELAEAEWLWLGDGVNERT